MKSVALNAVARTQSRRAGAKQLRENGRIPAVIYGRETKPQNLELNAIEMNDLMHQSHSENLLVDLAVKDDSKPKRLALVQEVQHHPLSGKVLHVDFHEVSPTEKVTIMVPVETTGEAAGVKNSSGVLEHVLFKIKVRGLPKDLPEQILIDVTALELNKTIHIGELTAPEGVEILGNKTTPVVSVAPPRAEEEVAVVEGKAAGDVEMTKEKKEDGTDAAPAKAGDKAAAKPDAKAAAGDKKAEAAKPDAKAEKKK